MKTIPFERIKQQAVHALHVAIENQYGHHIGPGATFQAAFLAIQSNITPSDATRLIVQALKEEGESVISRWDVRSVASLIDAAPESVPRKYAGASISAEMDDQGEWQILLDETRPRGRWPKEIDTLIAATKGHSQWADSVIARVTEGARQLREKNDLAAQHEAMHLQAIESALPSHHVHNATFVKEQLLRTWLDTAPSTNVKPDWRGPYWITAETHGLTLATRPAKVMDRSAPFASYLEVDGVLYQWVDANGVTRDTSSPADAGREGQPAVATFDYFALQVAKFVPADAWTATDAADDAPEPGPGQ